MAAVGPTPIPETVEALLDTTWRTSAAENSRTEALDRKATTLATFASLVLSLTASLGGRLTHSRSDRWIFALYALGLFLLVFATGFAVWVLRPKEQLMLGMAYLERFPKWSELLKRPEQVRGETMAGLIEAIAWERAINRRKAVAVQWAFLPLLFGLMSIAGDAAIVTEREILG